MSRDNVEIVKRFFEVRNRGGAAFLEYVDADAEFDLSESRGPDRGVFRGHDEIRRHFDAGREAWAELEMHPEEPIEVGNHVVVTVRGSVRGRASGIELKGQGANVYTLQDGKIVRLKLFQTRTEAFASVGLAE